MEPFSLLVMISTMRNMRAYVKLVKCLFLGWRGTGFSEAVLEERSASLCSKVIPKPKVWEVKAADLTTSPVHRAATGIVDSDKGISLRFPHLLRVQADKNPEDASSSDMVADMYRAQKHNQSNRDDNEEE